MPSRYADEENPQGGIPQDEPAPESRGDAGLPEATAHQETDAASQAQEAALARAQEATRWSEPHVSSQRMFRDIFNSGGKSAQELEQLLLAFSVNTEWVQYWEKEGFLTEVVSGQERHIALSRRAVLELELG
ncbi:MAG: hypothetical protein HYY02_06430 [Chloroflexi bacterium]|nr:hypothetical protein [Chloroflexota bacterium]